MAYYQIFAAYREKKYLAEKFLIPIRTFQYFLIRGLAVKNMI